MAQQIAVYCGCCCSLLGYFPDGIKGAVDHYGGTCPQCRNTTHHDAAEKARQQSAHRHFATTGDPKHCYVLSLNDAEKMREEMLDHLKSYVLKED